MTDFLVYYGHYDMNYDIEYFNCFCMKGKTISQFIEHIYLHLLFTILLLCVVIPILPKRIIISNSHIFVRPIFIIINTIINNFFYSMNYAYYYRLSFWSLWPSINNTQKSLNGSQKIM